MKRRDFLAATLAAGPAAAVAAGDDPKPKRPDKAVRVAAGEDRNGEKIVLPGGSPNVCKVSAKDTGGAMSAFESTLKQKGGPPAHVHEDQDEWFFVLEGEFEVQVGDDRSKLRVARAMHARLLVAFAFMSLVALAARAQDPAKGAPQALLDRMTGRWVMTGTIGKKPATHDVDVDWVLNREYIRIHEVSRDRNVSGGSGYEAWIYIVWDAKKSEYAVMWLDNTAATNFAAEGVGHAKPDGDRIPFVFKDADGGGIHTTLAYDRASDTWSWTIDNVDKSGKPSSFAKLKLTRAK